MKTVFLFMALASTVSAQTIIEALNATNATAALVDLLSGLPTILAELANVTNVTLLAPSNAAIANFATAANAALLNDTALLDEVISYHVLNGTYNASEILSAINASGGAIFPHTILTTDVGVAGGQYVEITSSGTNITIHSGLLQTSSVVQTDITFDGGIIHVIDNLLTLPQNISTTAVDADLTAVAGALIDTNLVTTVDTLTDVTVFAPTNAAFEDIASVLASANKTTLASGLTYHVVNNSVLFSTDLTNGAKIATLDGADITVTIEGSNIFINDALVVLPNVLVQNGVVHVIDEVLNPANSTATPAASASVGAVQFAGATSASSIALTSGIAAPTSAVATTATGPAASSSASGKASSTSSSKAAGATKFVMPVAGMVAAGAAFLL